MKRLDLDAISRALASNNVEQLEIFADQSRAMLSKEPRNALFLSLMGSIEFQLGHLDEAIQWIEKLLAATPGTPQIFFIYAEMLAQQNKFIEAIGAYKRALALQPRYAKAFCGLGSASEKTGNDKDAIDAYKSALAIDSNYPEALNNLGVIYHKRGDACEAIRCFAAATAARPDYPFPLNNLGMLRLNEGNLDEAELLLRKALTLAPNYPEALNNLGMVFHARGDLVGSRRLYQKALDLQPNNPDALNNLGTIFLQQDDFEGSESVFNRVLELHSGHSDALNNLGNVLKNTGRIREAISAYERAIELKPDKPDYHHNLAMALLAAGRFEPGWREFEWRWKTSQFAGEQKHTDKPLWTGEPDEGKVLLICAEQGYGDTIQFCRYAPLAAAAGMRVILEVQPALTKIMGSLRHIEHVTAQGRLSPDFDFYCPLMSLPLVFGTTLQTIPADVPYLAPSAERVGDWRDRLADISNSELKVGLVWAGSARLASPDLIAANRRRSMAPELFAPLMDVPGVRFFSLQKGGPRAPGKFGLVDFMRDCRDFADTAGLVANLDLVISVDTAVAHLAGAMAKPVWLLNRFDSCWRWLQSTDASPWYSTFRIFRQRRPGDWGGVISTAKDQLLALAENR